MTVTTAFATDHFKELAAAAAEGSPVYIEGADGRILELRPLNVASLNELSLIDEEGNRKFGSLPAPITWEEWEAIERDWDGNAVSNLWMNRDDRE